MEGVEASRRIGFYSSHRGNTRSDLGPPHPTHSASYQLTGRPHWGQRQRSSIDQRVREEDTIRWDENTVS
jgi:hypothetical protein